MESQRTKNSLLLVIALCLVLIVLKIYSVDLVKPAIAESEAPVSPSFLYACIDDALVADCKIARNWRPVRITKEGKLDTQ